jgi:hypothetical protein
MCFAPTVRVESHSNRAGLRSADVGDGERCSHASELREVFRMRDAARVACTESWAQKWGSFAFGC